MFVFRKNFFELGKRENFIYFLKRSNKNMCGNSDLLREKGKFGKMRRKSIFHQTDDTIPQTCFYFSSLNALKINISQRKKERKKIFSSNLSHKIIFFFVNILFYATFNRVCE